MTGRELLADGILVLTAMIWGTGFVVMKNTLDSLPPGAIIMIRYAIAAVLTAVIFRKHLKNLTKADVLRGALQQKCAYLGMIGSRHKDQILYDILRQEGVTQAQIDKVYAPIGEAIFAETPEEIGVSIAAELIRVRSGHGTR